MGKLAAGLFSQPSGTTGDLVFGAARTRRGKVVTFRQKVSPSNPDTPDQQNQRSIFSDSVDIVKAIGPSIYSADWNRSVGQLPGFQSLMSIMMNNMSASGALSSPPDVALGDLHYPDTAGVAAGAGAGELDVTWSTELGANGTAADEVIILAIPRDRDDRTPIAAFTLGTAVRSDGAATITSDVSGENHVVGIYFRGAGTADGLLSLAEFDNSVSG